jgi:4,5-dihydroxyphthalate decarboxylase
MYADPKPTLKVLLGEYPKTRAIRDGAVGTELATLDIADIPVAQNGFKALMNDLAFDFAEVAIVTYLVGRDHGKPYALLPFVMNGGFHHGSLYVNVAKGPLKPKDLEGRRIALRSYSQTTPTWVRGILSDEYGVDLDKITWVTFEDGHVAGFRDPPNCVRAPAGAKLTDMLLNGEVDAAMLGQGAPDDPRIAPLIPDAKAAALAWYDRHKAVPINHMMVVRNELLAERPDIVRDLFRMVVEARAAGGGAKMLDGVDLQPIGLDNLRNALALAADYAYRQRLIRKPVSVDELFDDVTAHLTA